MKDRKSIVALTLIVGLMILAIAPAQTLRDLIRERGLHPLRFWEVHHSVISRDGTFVRLFRMAAPANTDSTANNAAMATWKFQIVPLSGESHDLTLPGFPSLFAFGESNNLFVTVPDPAAWKNLQPGRLPANAKTKLYILSSPYDDTALNSAVTVDITGFVGSLRVRDIGNQVLAYMTVRNLNENPSLSTEETELDRHLVVVSSTGQIVEDVVLETSLGKSPGNND